MQPLMAKTGNTKVAVGDNIILKRHCVCMKIVARDNFCRKATQLCPHRQMAAPLTSMHTQTYQTDSNGTAETETPHRGYAAPQSNAPGMPAHKPHRAGRVTRLAPPMLRYTHRCSPSITLLTSAHKRCTAGHLRQPPPPLLPCVCRHHALMRHPQRLAHNRLASHWPACSGSPSN